MKKIVLLLLALLFAGVMAVECQAADADVKGNEKKKTTKKSPLAFEGGNFSVKFL